jgi:hypothetical protein
MADSAIRLQAVTAFSPGDAGELAGPATATKTTASEASRERLFMTAPSVR